MVPAVGSEKAAGSKAMVSPGRAVAIASRKEEVAGAVVAVHDVGGGRRRCRVTKLPSWVSFERADVDGRAVDAGEPGAALVIGEAVGVAAGIDGRTAGGRTGLGGVRRSFQGSKHGIVADDIAVHAVGDGMAAVVSMREALALTVP